MALLSRDDILNADDLTIETVAVPEWGGEVNVKTLTGAEKDKWQTARARSTSAMGSRSFIRSGQFTSMKIRSRHCQSSD